MSNQKRFMSTSNDFPIATNLRNTTIHEDPQGGHVFLTESGAVGMEYNGRICVHSIEQWIALSWRDIPPRALPADTSLACGLGDQSISLRGHPYER